MFKSLVLHQWQGVVIYSVLFSLISFSSRCDKSITDDKFSFLTPAVSPRMHRRQSTLPVCRGFWHVQLHHRLTFWSKQRKIESYIHAGIVSMVHSIYQTWMYCSSIECLLRGMDQWNQAEWSTSVHRLFGPWPKARFSLHGMYITFHFSFEVILQLAKYCTIKYVIALVHLFSDPRPCQGSASSFLGPLHVSPIDRAGLVTKILPHSYFLCKNFDVFTWEGGPAWLQRTWFLQPRNRDLGSQDENFPMWTLQPG